MSDNALPTLFKKYMQVSAGHARKYGGTGLGLAICKQLVSFLTNQAICDLYFICNKLKFSIRSILIQTCFDSLNRWETERSVKTDFETAFLHIYAFGLG